MSRTLAVCVLGAFLVAACVIAAVDYSGKACPCPAPWVCSPLGVCEILDSGPDKTTAEASSDARMDAPSRDAATDAGANEASWCHVNAPDAFFCSDFDEKPIDVDWNFGGIGKPVVLSDADAPPSRPYSLLATPAGPVPEGGVYSSYAQRDWLSTPTPTRATAMHLAYALDFSGVTESELWVTTSELLLYSDDDAGAAGTYPRALGLLVYGSDVRVQELIYSKSGTTQGLDMHIMSRPAPGTWSRIVFDVVLEADTPDAAVGTCTVTVDGNPALDMAGLLPGWRPGVPGLEMGMSYVPGPQTAPSVRIDNVTLEIK